MSKTEQEPVVVNFDDEPLLAELELVSILKDYRKLSRKEKEAKTEKSLLNKSVMAIIEAVNADTVIYDEPRKGAWKATIVRSEPGEMLDLDKLKMNLGMLGKLDAARINGIIAASMVPTKPKDPYVKITPPKE